MQAVYETVKRFILRHATQDRLVLAFYLQSAAFFLCPSFSLYLVLFYAVQLPIGVALLWMHRPAWLTHPILLVTYVFLLYSVLTLVLNFRQEPTWCLELLKKSVTTLVFLWCAILFFLLEKDRARYWDVSLYWIVAAAVFSIIRFMMMHDHGVDPRLEPLAQAHQPILGAIIYGLFGLFALERFFETLQTGRRIWYGAAIAIILVLVVLTQSKGPMVAIAIGYTMLAMLRLGIKGRLGIAILLAGAAAASLGAGHYAHSGYFEELKTRGLSFRPQIWAYAWGQIIQRPVFGYGLGGQFAFQYQPSLIFRHPHCLMLATLYYTGIVGLVLKLMMFAMGFRGVVYDPDRKWRQFALVLFVYLQLSMASDIVRLITGPKELQFIFWLPFAQMVAYEIRRTAAAMQEQKGAL